MDREIAEEVVETFEESNNDKLEQVLKAVKKQHHLSDIEIDSVRKEAEALLTDEMMEPEKNVDVC